MKNEFEKYLNKVFKKGKGIKEIEELKRELLNDLILRSEDLKKKNIKGEENYKLCIDSLGDLVKLLKEYTKNRKGLNKVELPSYKLGEEVLNGVSHGIGVLLSILALVLLILKSNTPLEVVVSSLYGSMSIILYLMSTLYHSFKPNNAKKLFRILDHSSIFLLIAGTYTPYVLLAMNKPLGWTLFGIIWGLSILGIVLNTIDLKRYKKISMILYICLGWAIISTISYLNIDIMGIILMILAGVFYTVGAVLYALGKKKRYIHSVFHIFCLIASILFFYSIYLYVL